MSHNLEADFAASELAHLFVSEPDAHISGANLTGINATASFEPSSSPWPKSDGLVSVVTNTESRSIALEYKRPNEGVHGLLTALGQSIAYLHKGYDGVAVVVPRAYTSHDHPGQFLASALDLVGGAGAVAVYDYETPDVSQAAPFRGRLACVRPMTLGAPPAHPAVSSAPQTQWVHMREGSTTRDGFYRFLQSAKLLAAGQPSGIELRTELVAAVDRVAPGRDPIAYIANVSDDRLLSRAWVAFWFGWIATDQVLTPWIRTPEGGYQPPAAYTSIRRDDDTAFSQIFEGRVNGLKESLCAKLNAGTISEDAAWEMFIEGIPGQPGAQAKQGVRARAHSYREDVDSSLAQLQWIDNEGRVTERGYRFTTICERFGGANSNAAKEYFGATLMQTGRFAAFVHYVYRLSEARFGSDPLAFTRETPAGRPQFNEDSYWEYLAYLEDQMANELRVMRKVSGRARPRRRTEFQAELTLLRNYGFVASSRYRLGVGIPIDWDKVTQARNAEL